MCGRLAEDEDGAIRVVGQVQEQGRQSVSLHNAERILFGSTMMNATVVFSHFQ